VSSDDVAADLAAAIATAKAGGSKDRLGTKLPVRERLRLLLDDGTFVEDGLLANALSDGYPADGVITGVGRIEGRHVAVIAHDPTVKAGSWGERTVEKQVRILERADLDVLPVFYLVDSAGGRLSDQLGFFPGRRGASHLFHLQIALGAAVVRARSRSGCSEGVRYGAARLSFLRQKSRNTTRSRNRKSGEQY